MAKEALEECRLANPVEFVEDGVELLDYLRAKGRYAASGPARRPGLIILDLNMPKMDGRQGEFARSRQTRSCDESPW